jgi:glycosyltransferase involved in cell wall biosynthesis
MSIAGPPNRLKVAFLTTDNRDHFKDYGAPAPYFGPAPEAVLQGLALLPDLEVHIVSCTRQKMSAPEKLAPNTFFHLLHVRKLGWMRTLFQGCVGAVRKELKQIEPDIVHGQGTESHNAFSAVRSGFPNIITIHGNMRLITRLIRPSVLSYDWIAARLEGWTVPRSEGVVCITRHAQEEVAALARRTWVVPNAVHSSFFDVNTCADPQAPPRVLCVARVCPLKNQNALIRSLDALARKHRFELVFVGAVYDRDPYGQEFLKLVEERPWCKWAGYCNRSLLQTWLGGSALLVLSSIEENCPMVIIESMAACVPVLAARVGGVPDLITDGETGLLCDPYDAASMPAQIEKALSQPAVMLEMAGRARRMARERFHPKVVAQRHLEIYREVLAGLRSRGPQSGSQKALTQSPIQIGRARGQRIEA